MPRINSIFCRIQSTLQRSYYTLLTNAYRSFKILGPLFVTSLLRLMYCLKKNSTLKIYLLNVFYDILLKRFEVFKLQYECKICYLLISLKLFFSLLNSNLHIVAIVRSKLHRRYIFCIYLRLQASNLNCTGRQLIFHANIL